MGSKNSSGRVSWSGSTRSGPALAELDARLVVRMVAKGLAAIRVLPDVVKVVVAFEQAVVLEHAVVPVADVGPQDRRRDLAVVHLHQRVADVVERAQTTAPRRRDPGARARALQRVLIAIDLIAERVAGHLPEHAQQHVGEAGLMLAIAAREQLVVLVRPRSMRVKLTVSLIGRIPSVVEATATPDAPAIRRPSNLAIGLDHSPRSRTRMRLTISSRST